MEIVVAVIIVLVFWTCVSAAICSGNSVTSAMELQRLASYFARNSNQTSSEFKRQMDYLERAIDGLPKEPKDLSEEMAPWVRKLKEAIEEKN